MGDVFRHIMIAGGKTGGHLFPGIAVAQALERIHPGTRILFVGTDTEFEKNTLQKYGFLHTSIISRPVKGKNIFKKALSGGIVGISIVQSLWIIRKFRPDVVLGVGGFSSFAVVFSAWLSRIPTAIQEQNSIPGITNRILSRFVKKIFISFDPTKDISHRSTAVHTGNPVRKEPGPSTHSPDEHDESLILTGPDKFTILVTGGSQGAHSINKAFIEAVQQMPFKNDLRIIHQTGTADEEWIQNQYQNMGILSMAKAFFHRMPHFLDMADLVICRAGAGTISEITLKGLPAILIPFPFASDDHQTANAQTLVTHKAGIMIPDARLTPQLLLETITLLKNNPSERLRMGNACKAMAMADADEIIANELLQLAGKRV